MQGWREDSSIDVMVSMLMMCSGQEEVDPKKIMVGGMPYFITEDDIHEFFEDCGIIAKLECMSFADTGKFKGIAFITFKVIYVGFGSLSCSIACFPFERSAFALFDLKLFNLEALFLHFINYLSDHVSSLWVILKSCFCD